MDTSTVGCSAALWRDGGIVAAHAAEMARGQSVALVPMIQDVMLEAHQAFEELDAVAVTVGPGAFTGLRIGLAAARGMALALGVPCLGVTTLETVAHSFFKLIYVEVKNLSFLTTWLMLYSIKINSLLVPCSI